MEQLTRVHVSRIVLLALVAASCGSSSSQVASTACESQLVTAAQGGVLFVTSPECAALAGTRVVIPPNALAHDTVITVGKGAGSIVLTAATGLGPVVDLGPAGTSFAYPATVTLPYDPAGAFDPHHLFVQKVEATGATGRVENLELQISPSSSVLSFDVSSSTQFEVALDLSSCAECPAGSSCAPGTDHCLCHGGLTQCTDGGSCLDLRLDAENCGSCGNACPLGHACDFQDAAPVDDAGARCVSLCDPGLAPCAVATGFSCVDLAADRSNCGSCGITCAANEVCLSSHCINSCDAGIVTPTSCCNRPNVCGATCCSSTQSCIAGSCCDSASVCGGADGGVCCGQGESCVSGACCANAQACGDTCCGSDQFCHVQGKSAECCYQPGACGDSTCCGRCIAGSCCPEFHVCQPPGGREVCCGGSQTCLAGNCCDSTKVCGDACCSGTQICIDRTCCDYTKRCDTACCGSTQSCIAGACCDDANKCGTTCCGSTQTCISGSCCDNAKKCGAACCGSTQSCIAGSCCDKPCDATCCGASQTCSCCDDGCDTVCCL